MKLSDYVINTNMEMQVTKWTDHDNNKIKNKCLMVVDGKAADTNEPFQLAYSSSVSSTTASTLASFRTPSGCPSPVPLKRRATAASMHRCAKSMCRAA